MSPPDTVNYKIKLPAVDHPDSSDDTTVPLFLRNRLVRNSVMYKNNKIVVSNDPKYKTTFTGCGSRAANVVTVGIKLDCNETILAMQNGKIAPSKVRERFLNGIRITLSSLNDLNLWPVVQTHLLSGLIK